MRAAMFHLTVAMTNLPVNNTADSHSNLHSIVKSTNEELIYYNCTKCVQPDNGNSIINSFFARHIRIGSVNVSQFSYYQKGCNFSHIPTIPKI